MERFSHSHAGNQVQFHTNLTSGGHNLGVLAPSFSAPWWISRKHTTLVQLSVLRCDGHSIRVPLGLASGKIGSLWPCVLLHESHNLWIQVVLTPRTADTGYTRWWVDEFGAALAIVSVLLSVFIWWRQRATLGMMLPADVVP